MADSKQQDIVDLIVAAMQGINGTGSYQTTVGTNVTDWGLNFQEDELPAISVCDLSDDIADDGQGAGYGEVFDLHRLNVRIRISVRADARAAECRKMLSDVVTAVRGNQYWNNGTSNLALKTDLKGTRFVLDEEKFTIAAAEAEIDVFYRTQVLNAYQ